MLLKIKAFIYKITGIYLAKKEEKEYLKTVRRRKKKIDFTIGFWQVKNGFYRAYPRHYRGNPLDGSDKKKSLYGMIYMQKFTKSKFKKNIANSVLFLFEMVYNIYMILVHDLVFKIKKG